MTSFDHWWDSVRHSGESWALSSRMDLAEAAFKAGIQAAAEIAEKTKLSWNGSIGEGACDTVMRAIRQAAED